MGKFNVPMAFLGLTLLLDNVHAAVPQANDDFTSVLVDTPITIDVLTNDVDANGGALGLFVIVDPPGNGSATIVGNSIRYQPNAGFTGTDTFRYSLFDITGDIASLATVSIRVSNDVLSNIVSSINDSSVARALDLACAQLLENEVVAKPGQQQLRQRCNALRELALLDGAAAARIVNQIAPEETIALMRIAGSASQIQSEAVSQRLTGVGRGVNSISVNGVTYVLGNKKGGAAGDDSLAARGGFFASIQLETADKSKTQLENGFDYATNSVTVGADYFISHRWLAGAAAGLAQNKLEYSNEDGEVEATWSTFITYISFNEAHWSADFQAGYSVGDYDIGRHIRYNNEFDAGESTADGSTSGEQFLVTTQWLYLWNYRAATVYPSIKLSYNNSRIAEYTEENTAGFGVHLGEHRRSQIAAQIGLQAQYAMNFEWGVLVPLVEANVVTELSSEQDDVKGQFVSAPSSDQTFLIEAEGGDSAFYNIGVGTSFVVPNGISGFLRYDQTLSYNDFSSHKIEAGVRAEF